MPDTAENQHAYPQPGSQKPGCGFPMMKLVGLFCLASGELYGCTKASFFDSFGLILIRAISS